jgi:hypothetical protein
MYSQLVKLLILNVIFLVFSVQARPPFADKLVVGYEQEQAVEMQLTSENIIFGKTPTGILVTEMAHTACKDKLNLSAVGIKKFKELLIDRLLYNIESNDNISTSFSPDKQDAYFSCVAAFR